MVNWLFIGPSLLSGIGQVTHKYCSIVNGEFINNTEEPSKESYDIGFAFVLPLEAELARVDRLMGRCTQKMYMTVCETETVHPVYGILAKYKPLHVPSKFAKNILERQFPLMECKVLHHWAVPRMLPPTQPTVPYRFYTIGNAYDPRKNIKMLLDVFVECKRDGLFSPQTQLVIKATCKQDFKLTNSYNDILIINGLVPPDQLESIHKSCACYVNCSHSEGVGMGAVEAALHGRPVIATDYGGLKEYVKTPYLVPCKVGPIGFDDFLFRSDMEWGHPDRLVLKRHMVMANRLDIRGADHEHTVNLMKEVECSLSQMQPPQKRQPHEASLLC